MIWRNVLYAGVMVGLGHGMAQDPQTGRTYPMIGKDLAIDNNGHVEYVIPRPESGSRGSVYIRRPDSGRHEDDE